MWLVWQLSSKQMCVCVCFFLKQQNGFIFVSRRLIMKRRLDGVVANVTDGGRVRNLATAGSQGHTSMGRISLA